MTFQLLPRGAVPTPKHEIEAAPKHVPDVAVAVPSSFLMWPGGLAMWGNYYFGDCVSAEEAFAKATAAPQIFVHTPKIIKWARDHGYLNGATLTQVMKTMQTQGFYVNGTTYNDGAYSAVDYKTVSTLQSAIFTHGPIKIGVGGDDFQTNPDFTADANGLPQTGWCIHGYPAGDPEDHCVSLCGYGNLADLVGLFAQRGVTVTPPAGMPTGMCYALFTWGSIGIVDEKSMLNFTYEAWARSPVTVT